MTPGDARHGISEFDAKAQKKIIGYREKLVPSHTRNNQICIDGAPCAVKVARTVRSGGKSVLTAVLT